VGRDARILPLTGVFAGLVPAIPINKAGASLIGMAGTSPRASGTVCA